VAALAYTVVQTALHKAVCALSRRHSLTDQISVNDDQKIEGAAPATLAGQRRRALVFAPQSQRSGGYPGKY